MQQSNIIYFLENIDTVRQKLKSEKLSQMCIFFLITLTPRKEPEILTFLEWL